MSGALVGGTVPTPTVVTVPVGALQTTAGSPAVAQLGSGSTNRRAALGLDDAAIEGVGGYFTVPPGWGAMKIEAVWGNPTATTGAVAVWHLYYQVATDGASIIGSNVDGGAKNSTAVGQYIPLAVELVSNLTVIPGQVIAFSLNRDGDAVADTFVGDAYLLYVRFQRLN